MLKLLPDWLERLTPNDMKDAMGINIKQPLHFEAERVDFERLCDAQRLQDYEAFKQRLNQKLKCLKLHSHPVSVQGGYHLPENDINQIISLLEGK